MAKVLGGLHGRASGNVSGIVYGAARTRTGKVVTARELVFPSNPQTAAQVLQRLKFKQALYATRHLTATIWQDWFNRAIGQLPGFQSMMSIILENTDASEEFQVPPDTPLGNLHFPDTYAVATGAGASKTVDITWSTELGLNGTDNDEFKFLAISVPATNTDQRDVHYNTGANVRSGGSITLTCNLAAHDYVFGAFLEGTGSADGLLSPCVYDQQTTKA